MHVVLLCLIACFEMLLKVYILLLSVSCIDLVIPFRNVIKASLIKDSCIYKTKH